MIGDKIMLAVPVGDIGIVGGKKILLDNLLPATTEELAAKLNLCQKWRLEKGKPIIPRIRFTN